MSDRSRKNRKPTPRSLDGLPKPPVTDWDLPGIRKPKQRASLAPPAPPISEAPPAPTTHELFDVDSAEADYVRDARERRRAARTSARPHPPRRGAKPADVKSTEAVPVPAAELSDDPVHKLSTPLSWAAAKDPTIEEAPDDLLEPVLDSAPLALPPIPSNEPLASAIPSGSVVVRPPSSSDKRLGKVAIVALAAGVLIGVGVFVTSNTASDRESLSNTATNTGEPSPNAAAVENVTSEANPALRVPLPPLELDIGVPVAEPLPSASASAKPDPLTVPPVAPSGVLPQRPPTVEHPPFNGEAATQALNGAAQAALSCRKEGDPSGTATVIVRYAPSGRVTSSIVESGPFVGTVTGGCIATTFRRALVPPFSGDYVTVKKTVSLK